MDIKFLTKTKDQIFADLFNELDEEFDIYNILDNHSCFVIKHMITYEHLSIHDLLQLSYEELSKPTYGLGKKRAKKMIELWDMIRVKYNIQ